MSGYSGRPPLPYFEGPKPRIFAHRGLVLAPGVIENSEPAFAAALDAGADYLETDIRTTRDGVPILFHDESLERLFGQPERVSALRLDEIREVAGDVGLLTLEEAFVRFPGARFNLDLKEAAAITPTVRAIQAQSASNRVLLASFSQNRISRALSLHAAPIAASAGSAAVLALRALGALGASTAEVSTSSARARLARRLSASFHALQLPLEQGGVNFHSPGFIKLVRSQGLELHYWVVNDPETMLRLVESGATGIVTDRADLAVAALRE